MGNAEKLFTAFKSNNYELIKNLAEESDTDINAKNTNQATILHIAAWKGQLESVKVILACKGDPNIVGVGGSTALHYAVKFGHLEIVKELLSHGAIYDMKTDRGKSPLELCKSPPIKDLLLRINHSFQSILDKRTKLINDLNKIEDKNIAKAVVNARNGKKLTLVEAALISGCIILKHTWDLFIDDEFNKMRYEEELLIAQEKYDEAIQVLKEIYQRRVNIFGHLSPASLLLQKKIFLTMTAQGKYHEALENFNKIYELEKETLGDNCSVTLESNVYRGESLFHLGRYKEALPILETASENLSKIEEKGYTGFCNVQCTLGSVYLKMGCIDKALVSYRKAFKLCERLGGPNHSATLTCLMNIAVIYSEKGRHAEARHIFQKVFNQQKSVFGIGHSLTLQILYNISLTHIKEGNTLKGEALCKELLEKQLKYLGNERIETLKTQRILGMIATKNGKITEGQKFLNSCLGKLARYVGPNHPNIVEAKAYLR